MIKSASSIKKLVYMMYLFVATLGATELTLRFFVDSDPAFYVAFSNPEPGSKVEYPYGEILYNTAGFADDEFDSVKTRPRVGYIGDSVCFGVGAGYGYRVSEVIKESYPGYEHMNFTGGLGGGTLQVSQRALRYSEEYDLDAVVYLMNLNDIRPEGTNESLNNLRERKIFQVAEWFRGRSYLYTYLRQVLKDLRSGDAKPIIYEMYPREYDSVLEATAKRIESIGEELDGIGVRFVVLIVPYEMQISSDAARVYEEAGTQWGPEFLEGSTQALLREYLPGVIIVDGLDAFKDQSKGSAWRDVYQVGEAYVYNLGERLDWNHPNRLGHSLLAKELGRSGALDSLEE